MLVELSSVDVYYGPRRALSQVTAALEPGRIGLLGPNGAGKTSLLRALLGLVRPTHGSVRVLGTDVGRKPLEVRARLGYMPEGGGLLPDLSALEHVRLASELCGLPPAEGHARAHQTLHYVGLGESRYRRVGSFSTGMQQRVRLAQALVGSPELLLLDEPTSGLDPQGREEMLALLVDIPARTGASLILSTHILPDVERTCDQVLVLGGGEVLYSGELEALLQTDRQALEVRGRGDLPAFRKALELDRFVVVANSEKRDSLVVRAPATSTTTDVLRVARTCGFQVRHLAPLTRTLEEAFLERVAETGERPL